MSSDEILGIIGPNGAGKSTLLKILSHVTVPTSSEVRVKGRIAWLLKIGIGLRPHHAASDLRMTTYGSSTQRLL